MSYANVYTVYDTLYVEIGTLINCFSVCILYMCVYMSTAVWMYVGR